MRLLKLWSAALALVLTAAAHAQDPGTEYRLGAGDGIRISVFQNPNLTLETRVAEDATVSYPMIGRLRLGGMKISEAERTLAKALEDGNFIKEPQVNILLLQIRSHQVSVLGLVNRAGRYPLETFHTRVSEMIALAGGVAGTGADLVILSGERAGKPFRKEIDLPALFLGVRQDDDIVVAGGDVLYVHRAPLFYVYGEVQRPGSYRVERGMTIRQALVQGGGPSARGTERALRLWRDVKGKHVEVPNPGLDATVQPDDVLHVGESLF